jgi:hypothetical protein
VAGGCFVMLGDATSVLCDVKGEVPRNAKLVAIHFRFGKLNAIYVCALLQ